MGLSTLGQVSLPSAVTHRDACLQVAVIDLPLLIPDGFSGDLNLVVDTLVVDTLGTQYIVVKYFLKLMHMTGPLITLEVPIQNILTKLESSQLPC